MRFSTLFLKIFFLLVCFTQTISAMLLDISEDEKVYQALTQTLNAPWKTVATDPELRKKIVSDLQASEISGLYPMGAYLTKTKKEARFNNEVWMVLLAGGLKAVFKPKTPDDQDSALGEAVAYQCAEFIALTTEYCLVPPTTTREIQGFTGSLQWFVASAYDLWQDRDRSQFFQKLNPNLQNAASHFLFVWGQWDAHPGNYMGITSSDSTQDDHVALIDNEGIVNLKITLFYNRPFIRIAYEESSDITDSGPLTLAGFPSLASLRNIFKDKVPEPRLNAIFENFFGEGETQDTSRSLSYILKNKFPWIQYHANNPKAFPIKAKNFSGKTRTAYEALTLPLLRDLFKPLIEFNSNRFSDVFLNGILERRDMLLTQFPKKASLPLSEST